MIRTLTKTLRLIELVDLMKRRPRGVGELAAHFGTTRRTIERDLDTLRDSDYAPVEENHRYSLPARGGGLNEVEALAVHSATRLLVHTGIGERHYRSALEKLARDLPEPARTTLIDSVDRLEPASDDRNLDLVAQAWFGGYVLACEYHSFSSGTRRKCELEIYYYEVNRRNLDPYVVAYERRQAQEIRTFKLARIRQARLLEETYRIPDTFDPHEHLAGAWGVVVGEPLTVTLRATPAVAPWFRERQERDPHLTIVDAYEDGGVKVELTGNLAQDGSIHELSGFLLGWGPTVEVLAPDFVRKRVRDDLRAAAEAYE